MRRTLCFLVAVGAACGSGPPDGADTDSEDTDTSGSSDATSLASADDDGDGDPPPGETTSGSGDATTGGPGSDDSTGDCDDDACAGDGPTLLWSTLSEDIYGDGHCQSVITDGEGGLFASYIGYGFEAYSGVFAVDASGRIRAQGQGVDAGSYVDLAPRGPGLLDWAAASGHVGIADASLSNLDGGMLGFDVDQIRAMVRGPSALHYAVRTTATFQCVVRTGTDPETDSVAFPCAPDFSEEKLGTDGLGNRYYMQPRDYRVLRIDPAGLLYGSVDGRWNRVGLDAAVDPDGHVWMVGAIGSTPSDVFGGFIARHDFDLSAEPPFEDAEEGPVVWTAVTMTEKGPVVFGHEGYGETLHARGLAFDGTASWSWSQEFAPQTYVNEVSVDADGNLLACGFEYTGEQTPVVTDVHHPLFLKFEL